MPQRDILQRWQSIGPHHTRQAPHVFRNDRIALMGHSRRPFLPRREKLLRLAQFGALQMAYFNRQILNRPGNHRQGRKESRMTVTRDHLCRHRLWCQTQLVCDIGLN